MSKYVTVRPIWEWEERVNKTIEQMEKRKYLVVTDHGSNLYSFDELLKEFWLDLQAACGRIGFWQSDCDEWFIKPTTANPRQWKKLMNELLNEIVENSCDVMAIACVKNEDFVAMV